MKKGLIFLAAAVSGLAVVSSAHAALPTGYTSYGGTPGSPANPGTIGLDSGPGIIIDYTGGTSFTITTTGQGTYDGSDDTYVLIENSSDKTTTPQSLPSINLSASTDIFGFDGDGISSSTYGAPGNGTDTTQYGGPESWFSGYSFLDGFESGTVNFLNGGLPAGDETYFSLENSLGSGVSGGSPGGGLTGSVPDSFSSMALLSGAFAGIAALRRRFAK